jgi:hypothetical protein
VHTRTKLKNTSSAMKRPKSWIGAMEDARFDRKAAAVVKEVAAMADTE